MLVGVQALPDCYEVSHVVKVAALMFDSRGDRDEQSSLAAVGQTPASGARDEQSSLAAVGQTPASGARCQRPYRKLVARRGPKRQRMA